MIFVEPQVTPIATGDSTPQELTKVIEQAYRICYKSEDRMKQGSEELIYKLLHGGEKGQNIHASPLEHRRVTLAVDDWVVNAVYDWQNGRGTAFISSFPQKTPSVEEHQWLLEGNLRAFFDFVKGYETDEEYDRRNEARLVINEELHSYLPAIFKHMEPYDDTDNAIEWEACDFIGESTDYMSFHVVTTRDVLQEIARNRTISPNVESTRYCNYNKRGMCFCVPRPYEWAEHFGLMAKDLTVRPETKAIDLYTCTPRQFVENSQNMIELFNFMAAMSEATYNRALELGAKPQEARMMLLGGLKTEMLLTGRYQDWAHFLKLRNDSAAHPQMVYIAEKIEKWFIDNGHADIRDYDQC